MTNIRFYTIYKFIILTIKLLWFRMKAFVFCKPVTLWGTSFLDSLTFCNHECPFTYYLVVIVIFFNRHRSLSKKCQTISSQRHNIMKGSIHQSAKFLSCHSLVSIHFLLIVPEIDMRRLA